MMKKFVLDAGHPWGLRMAPFCYMLREQIPKNRHPVMYDTELLAHEAKRHLIITEGLPLTVKAWDDGVREKPFLRSRLKA